jgi:thymidine kinase
MGRIEVITGPMFSGKTSLLIARALKYKNKGKRVIAFKPEIDNRYSENKLVSHDGLELEAIKIHSSAEISSLAKDYDVVIIDEAQFLDKGIVEVAESLADVGKVLIIGGLDKNYLGKPFGPMPELLAIADKARKLTAKCAICGKPASFTYRKIDRKEEILIGGADIYEARCRKHRK